MENNNTKNKAKEAIYRKMIGVCVCECMLIKCSLLIDWYWCVIIKHFIVDVVVNLHFNDDKVHFR